MGASYERNARSISAVGSSYDYLGDPLRVKLEYLIKSALASYLKLRDAQFDVVVGPYDFAMLCTVAEKTIKLDFDDEFHPALKTFFNKCRKVNQMRVVVAHGSWSVQGARYASRQSLK